MSKSVTLKSIETLAADITRAEANLAAAKKAEAADKRGRTSFFAKAADFVTTTAAETKVFEATAALEKLRDQAEEDVLSFVNVTALQIWAEYPAESKARAAQAETTEKARKRSKIASDLAETARGAFDLFEAARSACSSASSMETLDAFTSNKAISLISTIDTDNAKSAIGRAKEAADKLEAALQQPGISSKVDAPDDTFDLIIDFAFDSIFDFTSFGNIGKLDKAEKQCKRAKQKLAPLVTELEKTAVAAKQALEFETIHLTEMDKPFIAKAAAMVPESIRKAPEGPLHQNRKA